MNRNHSSTDSFPDRNNLQTPIRIPCTNELTMTGNSMTPEVALDCEMVEAKTNQGQKFSAVARVSIVNGYSEPLLDTYVKPNQEISDYRTRYSGIRPQHLLHAPSYNDVRKFVYDLIRDKIIVGHDLGQDLAVLGLKQFPLQNLRDTSKCYLSFFEPNQKPSLKRLASEVLGITIQQGAHDSMEDAKATMQLYKQWVPFNEESDAIPTNNPRPKPRRKKRNQPRRLNV